MNSLRFIFRFVGLIILMGGISGCATPSSTPSSSKIPLPFDINIVTPDPNLPKEIQALSGKWAGTWQHLSGSLDAMLIVEKVDQQTAQVIYASDDNAAWGVTKSWRREKASVSYENERVMVMLPSGIEVWLTKGNDNILEGRRNTPHGIVNIKMKKVP
jgi:hypothetical protein